MTTGGTLTWKTGPDGARRLVIAVSGGLERRFERRFLDPALASLADEELAGRAVDFDWTGGRAKRIRDKGAAPTPPPAVLAGPAPGPAPSRQEAVRRDVRQPPRHMAPSGRQRGLSNDPGRGRPRTGPEPLNAFANPYGFVPAPRRDPAHPSLGDANGAAGGGRLPGHDRLHEDRWSGTIGVVLTVETPLLLLDTARATRDVHSGHPTYDVLERTVATPGDATASPRPHLPATAVKGMLRSAFEAATNSRFGVFTGHDARLGYRMAARDGLASIPARVVGDGDAAAIELLPGTTPAGSQGRRDTPMHAAWLPSYWTTTGSRNVRGSGEAAANVTMPDGSRPVHGTAVRARICLVQHHRWDRRSESHVADFQLWWVRSLAEAGREPVPSPLRTSKRPRASWYEPLGPEEVVDGWACITNRNIDRKHDERVFFAAPELERQTFPVTERLRGIWRDIIHGYRNAHRPGEVKKSDPVKDVRAWSRHLQPDHSSDELRDGDLIYVRLDVRGEIESLYPVTIARELFSVPPATLLHDSLRPADTLGEMSPADRVFGWVRTTPGESVPTSRLKNPASRGTSPDEGLAAWLGGLRIGPVTCDQPSDAPGNESLPPADGGPAVARFPRPGLPLAILGQPKPGQGRFYVGAERGGHPVPLPGGLPKGDWFVGAGRTLRGRKVYPHHAGLPAGHWDDPTTDRTQDLRGGRYQEYRRPRASAVPENDQRANPLNREGTAFATLTGEGNEKRDDQNRSVTGWVRPGVTFRFTIDVRNLSDVDLGALLWLLDLNGETSHSAARPGDSARPPARFHRLGLGKPLGFGSVRLTLDPAETDLRSGTSWASYYRALGPDEPPAESLIAKAMATVGRFQEAVSGEQTFDEVPHVKAFLAAATGNPDIPVHYPRVRPVGLRVDRPVPPDPRGRSFEWFVANEQQQGGRVRSDRGASLPDLDIFALPIHPAKDR